MSRVMFPVSASDMTTLRRRGERHIVVFDHFRGRSDSQGMVIAYMSNVKT